jgi:hypothetical protein
MASLSANVSANPQRYSPEALGAIGLRRVATVHDGALLALRLGRMPEARAFVEKALHFERSLATCSLYVIWRCLENPVGRLAHQLLRKAWRLRHYRPRAAPS